MRQHLCVIGLGLIGGSLLRAAQAAGYSTFGYNRPGPSADDARADNFTVFTDLNEALAEAQNHGALIVVAVPMPAVAAIFDAIAENAPSCPVTDVVSVKAPVLAAARRAGIQDRFVGGHPMAGVSASGWSAGSAKLFEDAAWVVAVDDDASPAIWLTVGRLALDCGARVVPVESGEHDRAVARISHLPHILAEALAVVGADGGQLALGLAAGSFRDGTRVAASAPGLVRAMCEANSAALGLALDDAIDLLSRTRESLASTGSADQLITAGHSGRGAFENATPWEITTADVGSAGWVDRLRDAGRRGGVIRGL